MANKKITQLPDAGAPDGTEFLKVIQGGNSRRMTLAAALASVNAALANKQDADADLSAIAALATTAYGRALLTLADQAALQAAVGSSGSGGSGGGGGSWLLKGTTTIGAAVAGVEFKDLTGDEILLVTRGITKSVSGVTTVLYSVDNGATYFNASGDYVVPQVSGAEAASTTGPGFHGTGATAARSGAVLINARPNPRRVSESLTNSAELRLFIASDLRINAVKVIGSSGGNLTGGTIDCLQRGGDPGVMHVYDEKPSGTAGGSKPITTWTRRDLNTVAINTIAGASLAGNEITLPAGQYEIVGSAPAFGASADTVRLYNVTGAAVLVKGESVWVNNTTTERRVGIRGSFTLAVASVVRIEQYASANIATNGFGVDAGMGAVPNHFTDIYLRRVA